ncbi:MAG TPA: GNAT family N-acetyltransferase [Chlorobaculum sp.]|nr:GNAT family N-acetyltransferase [Chlorobaculum sp.]
MNPISDYKIRTMKRHEVDMAVEWAATEGWNPGLEDAECFYRADPEGFLVGLLGDEPVSTISVVRYGDDFGFLGFYIVRPEYRGLGLGIRIWNAGLARLGGRSVGLDGVVAQQNSYRKSGFTLAYRNIRYMGFGGGENRQHPGISHLGLFPFEEVLTYDQPFFPADRKSFLECWINRCGGAALGIQENGVLAGYGVIRPCRSGYKIGPLFADRPDLAESLYCALKCSIPEGSPLFLDIPEINPGAQALVQRHNMTVVFETARMYKGKTPTMPLHRIFGVTTFELG